MKNKTKLSQLKSGHSLESDDLFLVKLEELKPHIFRLWICQNTCHEGETVQGC